MDDLQERFKNFGTRKLLKILETTEKYEPDAIEAAKLELSKRHISSEEVQSVKDEILAQKAQAIKVQERTTKLESKAKSIGATIVEYLNPIQYQSLTTDRKINLIVILFGLLAVTGIYQERHMINFMLFNPLSYWDISTLLYFVPLIVLPVGVFLFWRKNKAGWALLCAYFVFNIVVNSVGFFKMLNWEREKTSIYSSGEVGLEIHYMSNLFPDPIEYLMVVVFYSAFLWVIFTQDLRTVFHTNKKNSVLITAVSTLVTALLL